MQPSQPSGSRPVQLDIGPEFQALYSRVCTALNAIHNSRGASSKVKDLTRIAEEKYNISFVLKLHITASCFLVPVASPVLLLHLEKVH